MAKKPTMAQAYKAAAKKSGDKGVLGEGTDVVKASGTAIKQQAEFIGAVGKGVAKGAGAVAKGAEKVAGKVANITVGDIASAPKDIAKNAGKAAAKVGKILATPAAGSMIRAKEPSKAASPKPVDTSKKGPSAGGKTVDRQYQGGSGSRKYPTNIPKGYKVVTLLTNPPKYKLVETKGKGK
jgi:hypothetical protein